MTILSSRLRRAYVRERSARTTGEADLEAQYRAPRGGRAGPRGVDDPPGGDREPGGRADARRGGRRDPRSRAGRPGRGGRRGQPRHGRRSVGRGHRGAWLPGLRARRHRGARPRVAPARCHRVGQGRVPPRTSTSWLARYPASPPRPRAGVAGRRRDRGAADDRGVANPGGDRVPVRPRPGLRRRHARPGDPAGGPGRPGARPRARVGRRPAVSRGPRARPGTARVARPGERCPGLRDRHRRGDRGPARPDRAGAGGLVRDRAARRGRAGARDRSGTGDARRRRSAWPAAAPRSLGSWLVPASAGDGPTILALGDPATTVPEAAAAALAELGTVELLAMPISTPGGDPQGSIVLGAADAGRFGPDDQALVAGSRRPDRGRRGAVEPVRRGHPVQGHGRRQRRRRLHVRPRLAPPDLCQPRRGRPAGRRARRARRDERARAAAGRVGAGLPRPARRPARGAVLDDDLLRGAGPRRRPGVPRRGHPPGGDAARRDADGGPHRARHQRADRRPGAAGPDRRRRATTGRGAPRRHPVDGRGRAGRRRRRSGSRWPTRPQACCSARTLPRGWPTSSAVRAPGRAGRPGRTAGTRRGHGRADGPARGRAVDRGLDLSRRARRQRRGRAAHVADRRPARRQPRPATPRPRARRSWASCRTSCGRR